MKNSVHTCIVHSKKWTYTFESASRVAGVWQGLNDPANHNVDAIAAESCSYNGVLGTPVIHHLLRIADRRLPHKNLTPPVAPSAIIGTLPTIAEILSAEIARAHTGSHS